MTAITVTQVTVGDVTCDAGTCPSCGALVYGTDARDARRAALAHCA